MRQTELLVAELLGAPTMRRAQQIACRMAGPSPSLSPDARPSRAARNEADLMTAEIGTLRGVAARLEARLLATPLVALGPQAAEIVAEGLMPLMPILTALGRTITRATRQETRSG